MLQANRLPFIVLVVMLLPTVGAAQLSQAPASKGTAVCDCKPEFNTTAEGPGTCQVAKDNAKWCKIKFNSGTAVGTTRQEEFRETLKKFGLPSYDNVTAAQMVNLSSPDKWDANFVQANLPPLIAVALWDVAPERIKPVTGLLSAADRTQAIAGWLKARPPRSETLDFGPYKGVVSWGCLELVQGQFSVIIKTAYSASTRGCAYK